MDSLVVQPLQHRTSPYANRRSPNDTLPRRPDSVLATPYNRAQSLMDAMQQQADPTGDQNNSLVVDIISQ